MSFGLRCHLHNVIRCELSPSILPATYHCPFTEPFDGFKSRFGQSSGLITDSPTLESTLILGTDLAHHLLRQVCCRWTCQSSHHSPSLELSLGRSSPTLKMTYCGTFIGKRWCTPASGTLNKQRSSLRGILSHRGYTSVCFVPKNPFVAKRGTADPLRLGYLHFHYKVSRNFPQHVSILRIHEPSGSGGIISVVSFVDSSTSTSPPSLLGADFRPPSM